MSVGSKVRTGRTWGGKALHITALIAVIASFLAAGFPAGPPSTDEPRVSITARPKAQKSGSPTRSDLRVDVRMVLVPVTVADERGRPVMDLPLEAFHLHEGNVEQKVVSLFREEGPISVGFLFDASSSMKKRMDRSMAAIDQFLKSGAQGDEFFLLRFSDRVSLVQGFTSDPDAILSGLSMVQPNGWTSLLDAIYLGVQQMKTAKHSRKALFILSDGADNNSRYTESEVANRIRESDVRVYAVGLFERFRFLEKLAVETGGTSHLARKMKDLPEAIERLSNELRNQYVLGYYPSNPDKDGKYRSVRVAVTPPPPLKFLNVRWRHGYYGPSD